MKKIILVTLALGLCISATMAQKKSTSPGGAYQTIGLHGGYGWELSWQKGTDASRFEVDLGLFKEGVSLTYVKQFVKPFPEARDLYWYWGYGGLGYLDIDDLYTQVSLGVVGNIGLEYRFRQIPLTLSADWRPCIAASITSVKNADTDFDIWDDGFVGFIGLGIRYRF